jgi:ribosomal protein S18 acetylase RimI-like enzyme
VSGALLDELAESARNRGLKLIRSRVRTPGKRRFGKVGLTNQSGKPLFGMDAKGPTANPEEVEDYLRNLGAKDWGSSLDVAVKRRKRPSSKQPASDPGTAAAPPRSLPTARPFKEKPTPQLKIRDAKPSDAAELIRLIKLLGHDADAKGVISRIAGLAKQKLPQLVATLDEKVVGLAGVHAMSAIHREKPVGRITILVVDEQARGQGIGRMLTEAAEKSLKELGCGMVEVTSNDRLAEAHAFYRHMGYERSSIRFFKSL